MGPTPGATPPEHGSAPIPGATSFTATASAYDLFMGRYSQPLAEVIARRAGLKRGDRVLDVGCGPGALTSVLGRLVDPGQVWACDPSPDFVSECTRLNPDANVRQARVEALPYPDHSFEHVFAALVMHFISEPGPAIEQMIRVLAPGGRISLSVWAAQGGPEMLSAFADAVADTAGATASEAAGLRVLRFGAPGALSALLAAAGCTEVVEDLVTVDSTYLDFDELWAGFLVGVGPPGAYLAGLAVEDRDTLRAALWHRIGSPTGSFTLRAGARVAEAIVPPSRA